MRKAFLSIALLFITGILFAQQKPKYKKNVIIPVEDFSNFKVAMEQWKRLCVYDPSLSAEEKIKTIQQIEAYGNKWGTILKIDSVLVKSDSVVNKQKKSK